MKLIIDVPDNVYAKVMEYYEHNEIVEAVYGYIYRGIPLDKIRAEIEKPLLVERYADTESAKAQAIALSWCLEIIDKYTK